MLSPPLEEVVESLINFTETELEACLVRLEIHNKKQIEEIRNLSQSVEELRNTVFEIFFDGDKINEIKEKEEEEEKGIDLSRKLKRLFFNDYNLPQLNYSHEKKSKLIGFPGYRHSKKEKPPNIITPEYFQRKNESETPLNFDKDQRNSLLNRSEISKTGNQNSYIANTQSQPLNRTPSKTKAAEEFFKEIGVKPIQKHNTSKSPFTTPKNLKKIEELAELAEDNKLAQTYIRGRERGPNKNNSKTGSWGIGGEETDCQTRTDSKKAENGKTKQAANKFSYHYLFSRK